MNHRRLRNTNTLSYNFAKQLPEDHSLDVLAGQEITYTKSSTTTMSVTDLPAFFDSEMAWNFLSSGSPASVRNYYNPDDVLLSFFGRVNYVYKHRRGPSRTSPGWRTPAAGSSS